MGIQHTASGRSSFFRARHLLLAALAVSTTGCASGEGELFLNDFKNYYLSGALTGGSSSDEGTPTATPEEETPAEDSPTPDPNQKTALHYRIVPSLQML